MAPRMQFICQSPACRRQVKIEIPAGGGTGQGSNLLCACGSKMKKVYAKPVLRELSKAECILRFGDGLYMLHEGSSSKSPGEAAILIGGAVCFTLGVMTLVSAVRSILWHRRMLRQSVPNH